MHICNYRSNLQWLRLGNLLCYGLLLLWSINQWDRRISATTDGRVFHTSMMLQASVPHDLSALLTAAHTSGAETWDTVTAEQPGYYTLSLLASSRAEQGSGSLYSRGAWQRPMLDADCPPAVDHYRRCPIPSVTYDYAEQKTSPIFMGDIHVPAVLCVMLWITVSYHVFVAPLDLLFERSWLGRSIQWSALAHQISVWVGLCVWNAGGLVCLHLATPRWGIPHMVVSSSMTTILFATVVQMCWVAYWNLTEKRPVTPAPSPCVLDDRHSWVEVAKMNELSISIPICAVCVMASQHACHLTTHVQTVFCAYCAGVVLMIGVNISVGQHLHAQMLQLLERADDVSSAGLSREGGSPRYFQHQKWVSVGVSLVLWAYGSAVFLWDMFDCQRSTLGSMPWQLMVPCVCVPAVGFLCCYHNLIYYLHMQRMIDAMHVQKNNRYLPVCLYSRATQLRWQYTLLWDALVLTLKCAVSLCLLTAYQPE
jgi:hypothetical protein